MDIRLSIFNKCIIRYGYRMNTSTTGQRVGIKRTVNPLPPSDAVRKQKFILEPLFSSVLPNLKNVTPLEI